MTRITAKSLTAADRIAPRVPIPPLRCPDCQHPQLIHRDGTCLNAQCASPICAQKGQP